jgi:leucyl aminopeptidase
MKSSPRNSSRPAAPRATAAGRCRCGPNTTRLLKSPFADLKNIGDGSAGTIVGAAFLKAFAPKGVPWAHLDIAATAWLEKEQPYRARGRDARREPVY